MLTLAILVVALSQVVVEANLFAFGCLVVQSNKTICEDNSSTDGDEPIVGVPLLIEASAAPLFASLKAGTVTSCLYANSPCEVWGEIPKIFETIT